MFGDAFVPWFQPLVREYHGEHWYLGEDYAFCERARQSGFKIMADTSIRLWHIGTYPYGWEDAGISPKRYPSFEYQFDDGSPVPQASDAQNNSESIP